MTFSVAVSILAFLSCFITLSIAKPPDSLTLTQDGSTIPPGATVEVLSNVDSVFVCTAYAANPTVSSMTWTLDGEIVNNDSGFPQHIPNGDNPGLLDTIGQLTLTPTWSTHGAVLDCTADHIELITPLQHSVTIDVKVPPTSNNTKLTSRTNPDGYLPGDAAIVNESTEEQFTCVVEGSRPAATIFWYVRGFPPNKGVVDTDTTQNPDDPLLSDTTSTLTFVPRRDDHINDLECLAQVPVTGATSYTFEVQLVVHGPPDSANIAGHNTATEFDVHQLRCEANNGLPAGQISWYFKGTDITNSSVQTNTEDANYRIDMRSVLSCEVTREVNGEDIQCEVRHQNLEGPPFPEDSITMNIKFCPETATFTECPANLVEGYYGELTCVSGSSNYAATIEWFTNGEVTNSTHDPTYSDGEYNGKVTTQKLTTENITMDDLGIHFNCCTVNPDISCGSNSCDGCHPEVYYSPRITDFHVPQDPILETSTEEVCLNITFDANPNPDVLWERDSNLIHRESKANGSSRFCFMPQRTTAGEYQCKVDNSIGDVAESDILPLTIHYEPTITSKSDDLWRPRPFDPVKIHCRANGNPLPTIIWGGPGGPIPVNGTERFELEDVIELLDEVRGSVIKGYLTIVEFDPAIDDGFFDCTSENYVGFDTHSIRVEEARVPETPSSVELLSELSTDTSLSISWEPEDDGGREQWYIVVYRVNEEDKQFGPEMEVRGRTTAELGGLENNTEYEIAVMSENDIGRSDGQESVYGWTYPAEPWELGITVVYKYNANTKVGKVTIDGLEPGSTVCVQSEISRDQGIGWEPIGECYSTNLEYDIEDAKGVQVRFQLCGKESDLCGEKFFPTPTAEKDVNNLVLIITLSVVLPICFLIVLAIILLVIVYHNRNNRSPSGPDEEHTYDNEISPDEAGNGQQVEMHNRHPSAKANDYAHTGETYERPYPDVPEFVALFNDTSHRIERDKLTLDKKIGAGHFATVHLGKCTSKAGNKDVAIKVLTVEDDPRRSKDSTNRAISNMAKELRNTLRVTAERFNANPNIVYTYGWSFERTDAEKIFIVMEYLDGGTLHELVKDRAENEIKIDDTLYYQFAYQIANGMEFLEHQSPPIVHRDLAARNVLLDSRENPTICKVADFGLARAAAEDSDTGKALYTVEMGGVQLPTRWYAIESLLRKEFTTKSDVWSFGILLWEMTAGGDTPYERLGIKTNELLDQLQRGTRLLPPKAMPKNMIPLMESCWRQDPNERPTFHALKMQLEKGPNEPTAQLIET